MVSDIEERRIIMKLPSRDSAVFRALVTGLQTAIGLLVVVLAMPEFKEIVTRYYPDALPAIAIVSSVVAYVWNLVRRDVKNY